jgi:hypothetical protein
MVLEPKNKFFQKLINLLDKINPVIVLVSVVGLILEFTRYHKSVIFFNSMVDIFFVFDFLIRLVGLPTKQYFFHGYGWVDLLAAIPGFTFLFEQVPEFFKLFKVLRIGRFFKIVRILRFLRIFGFLKKMKGESPFIQERIMKIGVVIVLVLVVAIGFVDYFLDHNFINEKIRIIQNIKKQDPTKPTNQILVGMFSEDLVGYQLEKYFNSEHKEITKEEFHHLSNKSYEALLINIGENESAVVHSISFIEEKHNIMLTIIGALISLITIVIFYIGFILAQDIKLINLINDSIDADDFLLLLNEGTNYQNEEGKFVIEKEEDEIQILFKLMNRFILEKNLGDHGMLGAFESKYNKIDSFGKENQLADNDSFADGSDFMKVPFDDPFGVNSQESIPDYPNEPFEKEEKNLIRIEDIRDIIKAENDILKEELLKEILEELKVSQKEVAFHTVKITSKSLAAYINRKILKHD